MAIKERKQVTGTTAQINAYAGHEGQLVWDKTKKKVVGMSGTAGTNYPMASESHTHVVADVDGLQSALDGKAKKTHTHAVTDVSGLQSALDGKLGATAKAESAKVADSANYVDWGNVHGAPSFPAAPNAHVTETYSSGRTFYRVWSNGFIEQWGLAGSEEKTAVVTLPKPFTSSEYNVYVSCETTQDYPLYVPSRLTMTPTSFTIGARSPGGFSVYWYACGF